MTIADSAKTKRIGNKKIVKLTLIPTIIILSAAFLVVAFLHIFPFKSYIDFIIDKYPNQNFSIEYYRNYDLDQININKFNGYTISRYLNEKGEEITSVSTNSNFSRTKVFIELSPISYNITYNYEGISQEHIPTNLNLLNYYTIEDYYEFPNISVGGYNFLGFYIDTTPITKIEQGSVGDLQIKLKFQTIGYSISYKHIGILPEYIEFDNLKTSYDIQNTPVLLPHLTNRGYIFDGYYLNGSKITEIAKNTTGDLTLETRWQKQVFSISYTHEGIQNEFKDIKGNLIFSYTIEDEIVLPNLTNTGYIFDGYYLNGSKITIISKGTTNDLQITTKWTTEVYTVTYNQKYNDALNSNPTTFTIEDEINLTNLSLANYKFVSWKNNQGTPVNTISAGTTSNVTLTASWSMVGSGTADDPYLIYNEDQLKTLFIEMNAWYKLENNITISYEWSPIGTKQNPFVGNFNGNGKTLSITDIASSQIIDEFAMFGHVGINGYVYDLSVSSYTGEWSSAFNCSKFAGIVLYNRGTIKNCINTISITTITQTTETNDEKYSLSGICFTNYGVLENCQNLGTLTVNGSKSAFLAGICCQNLGESAVITNCYSNSRLKAEAQNLVYIGKFLVIMDNNSTLRVSESNWDLNKYTSLSEIIGKVTTTQTGTNPVVIKPVVINNNNTSASDDLSSLQAGYVYWKVLRWTPNADATTGVKFLESWMLWQGGDNILSYQTLNKSGAWEFLNSKNGYGIYYTIHNGGFSYAYDENYTEITTKF